MTLNINKIQVKKIKAIGNRVLVTDMNFGEQKTSGGIVLTSDDGKSRGIYPRWGKVYDKGPDNCDDYKIGQWVLVEHGRWTRGIGLETNDGDIEVRMVEAESILAVSDEPPSEANIAKEYTHGDSANFRPEDFGAV